MSADKKNMDMKTYDAHDLRLNELQNKKAGMEECRSVYMTAGSKGAALWSGITAAGAWYSWQKSTCAPCLVWSLPAFLTICSLSF